jgi:hypothetical protein
MQANLFIAAVIEAAAPIFMIGVADVMLSDAASASTPLALPGVASATFVATGTADLSASPLAIGVSAAPADIMISPVYTPPAPTRVNPQFTYEGGLLSLIDYDGPHAKTFAYANGRLSTLDYSDGFRTLRKTFVWDVAGALTAVAEGYV